MERAIATMSRSVRSARIPRAAHSRGQVLLFVLALAVPSTAVSAEPSNAQSQRPERATRAEAQVYVPIDAPVIEQTPVAAPPSVADRTPRSPAASAARAVGESMQTAAVVPFVQLPGTAVPLWWLLLVLLAVPLARLWRSWTARMFV